MKTRVGKFQDQELIQEIKNSNVVAFPTETVYGLGVISNSKEAFEHLVETKKRRPDKPFTLMLSKKEDIEKYAKISLNTKRVIEHFMPGEITILVPPREHLDSWITLNSKYIGIRISGMKEVSQLIDQVGFPLLVTSANISGEKTLNSFEETYRVFNGKISYIVNGKTSSKLPSTIVICDENIELVRLGSISFEEIKNVWEGNL